MIESFVVIVVFGLLCIAIYALARALRGEE